MNNTEYFIQTLRNVDFISILTSVNILTNFFFEENLISDQDKFKPIPIVNSLCEYLNRNSSENATIALGKKLLQGSHFYGSNENDILDLKYVDAELNNIIASLVFSKFGNTFGYLSAVVNGTNNLTLPFVKRKIEKDLLAQTYLNEDYTLSTLTHLSINRITEKLIFPLFPDVTGNSQLRIVDVDYIYAQAGLMFARNAHVISANTSLEEYIAMAESIEQGVRLGHLNNSALVIFQLPALLYYTHKNPEIFRDLTYDVLVTDENFWNSAFFFLFSHLNVVQQNISSIQENNPVYLFESALFGYRNRTDYAEFILRSQCPHDESKYEEEINKYKNNPASYYCKTNNSLMPDINQLFSQQNHQISNHYLNAEKVILEEAISDELMQLIKQENVIISPVDVLNRRRCGYRCQNIVENLRTDTILFQISVNGTVLDVYAIIWQDKNITILSHEKNRDEFMSKLRLKPTTVFTVPPAKKILKYNNQTFDTFLTNLLESKRMDFYNRLQNHGYESTSTESVVGFLKNLIPFYTCVQAVKTETPVIAVCACIVDSIVLIPLAGQGINIGHKFFNAAVKPLLAGFQSSLKSFTIGHFVGITLKNFATRTATEFSKLITKDLFKDIGLSIVRTLDPGVELSYSLGKAGVKAITKCFRLIGRKMTSLNRVISSLNKVKQTVASKIGNFEGYDLFVNSMTGKDGYGVKYVKLQEDTVEFRRILGYKNEIPVVLVSDPDEKKKIFQIIDVESGELTSTRWELGARDLLQVETKPFIVSLKTIVTEGLSGRGQLINPRIRLRSDWMKTRERLQRDWSLLIDDDYLAYVLKNYVLDDIVPRTNILDHLEDFRALPESAEKYKLTNVMDYEILRYNSYVEDVFLSEEEAVKRVTELHRNKLRIDNMELNPHVMYDYYRQFRHFSVVNFEDFCAIGTYVHKGPAKGLLQEPEGWFIQNAFNRAAMRFIDFPAFDGLKSFYKFEQVPILVFDTLKPGGLIKFKHFLDLEVSSVQSLQVLRNIRQNSVTVNVLYEFVWDNSLMVVDVDKILPRSKIPAVGLPNAQFVIQDVNFYHYLEDNIVYKVTMKNAPIDKSEWIATLNKNIETLNVRINTYNNVMNDFNIDLL